MSTEHVPSVSVLMPVYNAERYVAKAVESILNQTFIDFEFIIINDGSTDNSLNILKTYAVKDTRIHLISRENKGLVSTLNELLGLAQGEFIARMDADDIALPLRFELQARFLQNNPDVVCVGGAWEIIDDEGRLLTCLHPPTDDEEIQQKALVGHSPICHPSAIIRRESIIKVGDYDLDMLPAEDLDLWLKLGEIGKLANLDEVVLKYRLNSSSISEKHQFSQRTKAREACERAWARRKITGTFEAEQPWRPGKDPNSRHAFMLQFGWWAFNSRQRRTAVIYGLKAIGIFPKKITGWKLFLVSLLKSPSSHCQGK